MIISSNAQRPMNDKLRLMLTQQLLNILESNPAKKLLAWRQDNDSRLSGMFCKNGSKIYQYIERQEKRRF